MIKMNSHDFEIKMYEQNCARPFHVRNELAQLCMFTNRGKFIRLVIKLKLHDIRNEVYDQNRSRPISNPMNLHNFETNIYEPNCELAVCNRNALQTNR